MTDRRPALFSRGSWPEARRIAEVLRAETTGGLLLLVATLVALVWVNSPLGGSYESLREVRVGPSALHLDLSLSTWAADGLLAVFFFVVGLELKREFVAGDLRDPRRAALPIAAALGGMALPALIYTVVNLRTGGDALRGWAIPTATDIAFALAVLAVVGRSLPAALRTFLLTLAVVDDLIAITIIALFYTSHLQPLYLLAALVPVVLFGLAVQRRIRSWWLLVPLAVVAWVLVHESGVHATVAGVVLGFTVPVVRSAAAGGPDAGPGLAEHLEHRVRPLSAGVAVPVFAFFASGVAIGGWSGLAETAADRVAIGVSVGLVLGKAVGILGTSYVVAKVTRADLDPDLVWWDVAGVAVLAGVGFTVSLLIGELAFGPTSERDQHVKLAVLAGSVTASLLAAVVLRLRERVHRGIALAEAVDSDSDGVPDVYRREARD